MAYRCPVCDTPQTDAEHLANHLAFTAVIRGDAHEAWLDDHVPEWGGQNPETLAPAVAEAVPEVTVPEFDAGEDRGHDHGGRLEDELARRTGHRGPGAAGGGEAGGRGDLTGEAAGVMEEARQLTEQMYGLDEDADATDAADGNADATDPADGNADDGDASDGGADDGDAADGDGDAAETDERADDGESGASESE